MTGENETTRTAWSSSTGVVPAFIISAVSILFFLFLDFLDSVLCIAYAFVDELLEDCPSPCYCYGDDDEGEAAEGGEEDTGSETLRGRKNFFRGVWRRRLRSRSVDGEARKEKPEWRRWSDCGCDSCGEWRRNLDGKLHVVVKDRPLAEGKVECSASPENVIFVHGFLVSSSFWSENLFPEFRNPNFRMFAMDLLGFGKSPKPMNCSYRLQDHVRKIDESVIEEFRLDSFHLVGHSMGCLLVLSLAAKYPARVKSVTLIAPPYFSSRGGKASYVALEGVAGRRVWPPLMLGCAVMSWYEHIGRTVCLVICRNHLMWERILRFVMPTRKMEYLVRDITKHTHKSAFHSMHNVICGGAKFQEKNLETIRKAGVLPIRVVHGDRDEVVPPACSMNLISKIPQAKLQIVPGADHNSIIMESTRKFAAGLEDFWLSSSQQKPETCP